MKKRAEERAKRVMEGARKITSGQKGKGKGKGKERSRLGRGVALCLDNPSTSDF